MRDVNLELASLLYDMAAIAGDSQRAFGYKRAAKAVLRIDRDITPLVTANTFKAIPGIGPTTDRIARELILDGGCAFVERAVRESGKEEEIARLLDQARSGSAMKIFIGSENELFALSGSSVIAAPYRGQDGKVVGVVGVIGPTRLNYARVVPMVDFTAKTLSRLLR